MSHQASAWALDARETGPLGAGARLVLATLADYADPQGHGAFPSKATIAARLGIDGDTVRKHLRTLEEADLIRRGDAKLVQHYPAWARPTVYNLALPDPPSKVRGASIHDGQGPQNVPDRGLKSEAQTKNITTHENTPQTPRDLEDDVDHDSAAVLAREHAAAEARRTREVLTPEGIAAREEAKAVLARQRSKQAEDEGRPAS